MFLPWKVPRSKQRFILKERKVEIEISHRYHKCTYPPYSIHMHILVWLYASILYASISCVGYHKKGYPNQSNKKRKGQNKLTTIARARALAHLTPGPQVQTTTRPTPWASDASSASPDPSGPQTQVLSRPTQGLGCRHRLARSPRPRA